MLKDVADKANWSPTTKKFKEHDVARTDLQRKTPGAGPIRGPGIPTSNYADGTAVVGGGLARQTIHDVGPTEARKIARDMVQDDDAMDAATKDAIVDDLSQKIDAAPAPSAEASKKRKSTDGDELREEFDPNDIEIPMPPFGPTQNCDQVRRKITRLLDSGEKKFGEFCNEIGVSSNALSRFRGQSGATKGQQSDVFPAAWEYFEKRELAGLKLPTKSTKKQKTSESVSSGKAAVHPDISDVHLPGEEDDLVPVYDSCDEIRKKIAAYLRKPEVTQAQFCRDLHAQLHSPSKPAKIQSGQLDRFRNNKGPNAGNTSSVFYAAYVFFEKIRIKEGKPKNKHRQDMEAVWPDGFDRKTSHTRG